MNYTPATFQKENIFFSLHMAFRPTLQTNNIHEIPAFTQQKIWSH